MWVPALISAFEKFNFSNNRRRAAAMGQFLVEAGPALNQIVEDLDYTPERASQVWPALFPTPAAAEPYFGDQRRCSRTSSTPMSTATATRRAATATASADGASFSSPGATNMRPSPGRSAGRPNRRRSFATRPKAPPFPAAGIWPATAACHSADAWDIDAITRRVNGDAMEAAGLRRQYSDEMVAPVAGVGTESHSGDAAAGEARACPAPRKSRQIQAQEIQIPQEGNQRETEQNPNQGAGKQREKEHVILIIASNCCLFRRSRVGLQIAAGAQSKLIYAPSRVAGHAPENVLPAVSSASTRNSLAPLGL